MLFTSEPKELTPEGAAALVEGKLALRNADERADAYVAGSRHTPLDELPGRLGELAVDTPVACADPERAVAERRARRRSTGSGY